MKPLSLLTMVALVALLSCRRSDPGPELPDYETKLTFACSDNLSDYYGRATLRNQQLCYSTNDAYYENFAYGVSGVVTGSNSAPFNPTGPVNGMKVAFGVGGWGAPKVPPAPIHFTIHTPFFTKSTRAFFLENIYKGAELNILSTEKTSQSLTEMDRLFQIILFAQYEPKWGFTNVAGFQSWSGPQDPATAYLRVLEMEEREDGSFDIAFGFRCKLYDSGRFYAEVTDGIIRTNIRF
ncbi:hypothetical protein [Telluribacter sp.]|jgi:hypothetical protein|uniref:hypothetical protein n=1 Tax=Telluribacter sp. TaxID=1978767 RepID=UPI002E13CDE3|nr:hypothetical protein [Telluribacter sp.]